jgi:lysozyme
MTPFMDYSESGYLLTKSFEQCRLGAYPDPGTGGAPWTIGWGHTKDVQEGDVCTWDQANLWLHEDVREAVATVNNLVNIELTQGEFDALVDFVYNVGTGNFASSTLLRDINAGDLAAAALDFEKWDHAGGKVMAGLLRRRQAEEVVFEQPTEPSQAEHTT